MRPKRILVTGGAGYIGSHACKALASCGFEPVVYDSLIRGHESLVKWGDLVVGDLRDARALDDAFERYQPSAVLHFAAFAYVGESVEDPAMYFENNVVGSLQLFNTMLKFDVQHLVFSSTCATYGLANTIPIKEDSPQTPTNPYGRSKLMIEEILKTYSAAYDFRVMILRYFNACGADADGDTGEVHDPEPHLIPRCLMAADGEAKALDIYGTDYPTPDGTCVRDYIHVSDLADAHIAALRNLLHGGETMALNLGVGLGFSVREVVRSVERVTGLRVPVHECGRRAGDPPTLIADNSRSLQVLGLKPRFTDLDNMISSAWKWYRRSTVQTQVVSAAS